MPGSKFTLSAACAGNKRSSEQAALPPKPFKVPKASEVTLLEQAPRPQPSARNLPATAPVTVCMYKYTDQAGDVWEEFGGSNVALWQVQIDHPVRARSLTYQMREGFNDYLRAAHGSDEALPKSVQELSARAGIRLVVSDSKDPEDVGFIQWRVAFYAAP